MSAPDSTTRPPELSAVPISLPWLFVLGVVTVGLVAGTTDLVSVVGAIDAVLGPTGLSVPPLTVRTIPIEIYAIAVVGGTLRFVYELSGDESAVLTRTVGDSADVRTLDSATRASLLYEFVIVQRVVALLAAVCLAAGIALVDDVTVDALLQFGSAPSYGAALFAGLFIEETYRSLGDVTERFLCPPGKRTVADEAAEEQTAAAGSSENRAAAAEGTAASTRMVVRRMATDSEGGQGRFRRVQLGVGLALILVVTVGVVALLSVPLEVSVYAFVGGLGYVYTALFVACRRESSTYTWTKYAFRITLGILLAVVGHLLLAPTPQAVPVVAFLIGLFPNVILERIERLARQFFARIRATG